MSSLLLPYLHPVQSVGGYIGAEDLFSVRGELEGKVLQRIRVYRQARTLPAIEVALSGEGFRVFGNPGRAESSTFEFNEGERITNLLLQESQTVAVGVARIQFTTSHNRRFDYGQSVASSGRVFEIDVGSGVCVGVRGVFALSHITRLGFVFLRPIESVRLYDVEYPPISSGTSTITTTILQELPGTLKNDDDHAPLHWLLAGSRQFVTRSTWSAQQADRDGLVSRLAGDNISINVLAGIEAPRLEATGTAGASTAFRWETGRTFPSTDAIQGPIANLTVHSEYSVWCHVSDTLAPGQSLITRRAAVVGEGNINNLPCSARIQVFTNTSSGSALPFATFTFPVRVLYSAQAHSDVQILS